MSQAEATAEVFWMAFSALPREARDRFMEKMIADPALREELEDLLDLEIVSERSGEPTRPLDEVLAELDEQQPLPYTLVINRSAERELKSLAPDIARRIGNQLRDLAENPCPAQSKRLKGSPNFRLRVGNYRVIYSVDDAAEEVTIVAVGHRREVYRRR